MVEIRVVKNEKGRLVFDVDCTRGRVSSSAFPLDSAYKGSKNTYEFETPKDFRYIVEEELGNFMDLYGRPMADLDELSERMEYAPFLAAYLESLGIRTRSRFGYVFVLDRDNNDNGHVSIWKSKIRYRDWNKDDLMIDTAIRALSKDPTRILDSFQERIINK